MMPAPAVATSQRRRFGTVDVVRQRWHGVDYDLDLMALRRAWVRRQVAGELTSMVAIAQAAGVSRSTVSRLFGGCRQGVTTVRAIVTAIGLELADVATPVEEEEPKS